MFLQPVVSEYQAHRTNSCGFFLQRGPYCKGLDYTAIRIQKKEEICSVGAWNRIQYRVPQDSGTRLHLYCGGIDRELSSLLERSLEGRRLVDFYAVVFCF